MRSRPSVRALLLAALCSLTPLLALSREALAQGVASKPTARLTKPPKLLQFVEAPYPDSEKAAGESASVVLQIAIGADGAVEQATVTESAGRAFDEAALNAVKRFIFEPAEIDGKPAPVKLVYRYEFVLKAELPTTARFVGTVRARGDRAPLAGVRVALGDGRHTVTDAQGRFSFDDVAPGPQTISLSGDTLTALSTEETFEAGKQLEATYDVEQAPAPGQSDEDSDDLEIVVKAPPLQKQVVSTEVSAEQGRRVPGTQGDVLKVVENLPGVARAAAGSGALVVWGAAPQDTRVYIDGVRVPRLYHDGGLRSVVHSDLVKSVELAPGGYGAAFGRGLGGLVTVATRPLEEDGFHGSAALDLLDAAAAVRAPIGEKLHVAVAARRSHLADVLPVFTERDVGALFPVPRYHDGQLKLAYVLAPGESVELGGLLSSDTTTRTVSSVDPAAQKRETRSTDFWRVYARYSRSLDDGGQIVFVPSFGIDKSAFVGRSGAAPQSLESESKVYQMRAFWRGRAASFLAISVGLDVEAVSSDLRRAGSPTTPAREGDIRVFGQTATDALATDRWSTTLGSAAPFLEADFSLLEGRLHMTPGVRFEPFISAGSRRTPAEGDTPAIGYMQQDTALEPRMSARYQLTDQLSLRAAYGTYHQSPAAEDLSAVFGNPMLGIASASQWLAAAAVRLSETLSLEVTGFLSRSRGLAIRSQLSSPVLAEALVQDGRGRASGGQLMLRKELTAGLFAWVSYSLLRSERTDTLNGTFRPFDFDQTHVLTAVASYDLGAGFELGTRARYASGYPRTPVIGAYYDARTDSYQPTFGAHNAERIPSFFQLDLRVAKRVKLSAAGELEMYLDVQNVTNRSNPEELAYSADYRQKRYITGLPILPVAGARWSW